MSTAAVVAEGPVSDLDPFSDAFVVDPFPALEQLRTHAHGRAAGRAPSG